MITTLTNCMSTPTHERTCDHMQRCWCSGSCQGSDQTLASLRPFRPVPAWQIALKWDKRCQNQQRRILNAVHVKRKPDSSDMLLSFSCMAALSVFTASRCCSVIFSDMDTSGKGVFGSSTRASSSSVNSSFDFPWITISLLDGSIKDEKLADFWLAGTCSEPRLDSASSANVLRVNKTPKPNSIFSPPLSLLERRPSPSRPVQKRSTHTCTFEYCYNGPKNENWAVLRRGLGLSSKEPADDVFRSFRSLERRAFLKQQ